MQFCPIKTEGSVNTKGRMELGSQLGFIMSLELKRRMTEIGEWCESIEEVPQRNKNVLNTPLSVQERSKIGRLTILKSF